MFTRLVAFAILLMPVGPASSTQIPNRIPPVNLEQAEQLMQDPVQAQIILDRIRASGMSQAEIQAQLRAAGLPSGLLDAYLGEGSDSLAAFAEPSEDIIDAMRVLGLGEFSLQDSLVLMGDTASLRMLRDSLRLDSIIALEDERRPLQLFGFDTFRQPTTLFQPAVAGPVGPSYILGPGDDLVLFLTGATELARQLTVTGEGFVVIPDVGRVSVAGITMAQLQALLRTRLARSYSTIASGATQFDVTVSRRRIINIRVAGEVSRPGSYRLSATATPLSAIYEASGLTELANFRRIMIRRGPDLVGVYDLYDFLLTGSVASEVSLQDGDVVFVPVAGPRITVAGEVKRPAIYELGIDETIADLIEAAGGLTAQAEVRNATISRIIPPQERTEPGLGRTVVTVNLQEVLFDSLPGPRLNDGDSLTVFRVSDRPQNSVTIAGSVWQPGNYQLTNGMTVWDVIQAAGGLKPETYSGRVQIRRLRPDSTAFLLGVVLPPDGTIPPNNPVLVNRDSVTIYTRTEFRPTRTIAVFGEVQDPGDFAFADSMTLRDAVMQAGGITDDAYLLHAEVYRRLKEPSETGDSLAEPFRVPLDSTFVFDPTAYVRRPTGGQTTDFVLEPYDQVMIRRQPGIERPQNVVVTGEVRFPGHYTLASKAIRLSDVVELAGGLTPHAYANGIRFFRAQGVAGRISVDLDRVLEDPTYRDNIQLALGDSIHIPRLVPTIRVEGAVLSPASVTFVPSAKTDYYVKAAGGYTRLADKGRTFVQQANGLIQPKGNRPGPGAVVVVPEKDPDERASNLPVLLSGLAQVLTALTTIIILFDRVILAN